MEPEPHNSISHVEELRTAHAAVGSAQRRMLKAVAACDLDHLWERDGARDFVQWLSAELGISNWAARRWVTAAHALPGLPRISGAFEAGELSLDKVLDLSRFATPDSEKKLIRWAKRVSPSAVREKADVAVRQEREETLERDKQRYLHYWWTDDRKSLALQGLFPADQGAVVAKALDRIAGRLPDTVADDESEEDNEEFDDPLDARRADALVAMCSRAIAEDQDADRATMVVHVDLAQLVQGAGNGLIENGGVIPAEVIGRLMCDARLQTVIHDPDGKAVGIGKVSRTVPRWLLRQLRYRDGRCTFPGCEARWFLQAHHIHWWHEGGPTDLDNLVLVCIWHHKLVHEYGWQVELGSDDSVTWFRPGGRVFEPGRSPPQPAVA